MTGGCALATGPGGCQPGGCAPAWDTHMRSAGSTGMMQILMNAGVRKF